VKIIGVISIFLFLTSAQVTTAGETASESAVNNCQSSLAQAAKRNSWKRKYLTPLLGTALAGLTMMSPEIYHKYRASRHHQTHIGMGIYFDLDSVLDKLSPAERAIVENRDKNPLATIELLNSKIAAPSSVTLSNFPPPQFFPSALSAADYFQPSQRAIGICRHQALILLHTLRGLGFKAQLDGFILKGTNGGHMWVYLPELDMVADPAGRVVMKKLDHRKALEAAWQSEFGKSEGTYYSDLNPWDVRNFLFRVGLIR
jgi:hypothetical protein